MITFFSLYFFNTYAQDLRGWHIGVALQPYNYWLRNQDEIDASPNIIIFRQPKLGIPNGFAGGFTFSKYFSDRFGLKGELTYSRQSQRYGQETYGTATFSKFRKLDYIKLPIMASFIITPFQRSSIYCNAGIQLSLLTRYRAETHYKSLMTTNYWDYYDENKKYYGVSLVAGDKEILSATSDLAFKRIQLGTLVEVGWLYSINENWNINFGVRGEYDVLKAENRNAKSYYNGNTGYTWAGFKPINEQSFSHNIRLGLNLGLSYKLD